jgi:putative transcriptional regulator
MKGRKLSDRELELHEAKRDVWREVLDGIDEIKAGGGKRYVVAPKTEVAKVRMKTGLSQS